MVCQIFLSLFIAIIVDSFVNQSQASDQPVTQADILVFIDCWSHFDNHAKGNMAACELMDLLDKLIEQNFEPFSIYACKECEGTY